MPLVEEKLSIQEQEILYEHYGVKLFYRVSSPLRDEGNPSFSTYESNGDIRWKDFGTGQGGNIYSFIMEYESVDFPEAVIIARDILLGSENIPKKSFVKKDVKRDIISSDNFKDYEISYWAKRGITSEQLFENKVYPLKMFLVNGKFKCTSTNVNPKFIYDLGNGAWKVYSPMESGEFKWLSHNLSSVNLESKPQGKHSKLVILSSKKDKMVFDNLLLPYDTTSVLSEGNFSGVLNEIERSLIGYKDIYCLLDFDQAGERATQAIENKSNGRIKGVYLPLNMANFLHTNGVKDVDDVMVKFGRDNLLKLINKIL